MSLKTPTNVKECHLLVMKFFLNILEAYQDFRFVGVMFSRAIHWELLLPANNVTFSVEWTLFRMRGCTTASVIGPPKFE